MPYIVLRERNSGRALEFEVDEVRLGRDLSNEIVPAGPGSEVVSGRHARFVLLQGAWHVEDLGSSNGTFLDNNQISPHDPVAVRPSSELRLGKAGPRYTVELVARKTVAKTVVEAPIVAAAPPPVDTEATVPMDLPPVVEGAPPPMADESDTAKHSPPELLIKLVDLRNGTEYHGKGGRIRLGRGKECEIRPLAEGDTVVSRVHAEITLTPAPDSKALLRDQQSRNGTIVNGGRLSGEHVVTPGDRIELGRGGPDLKVEALTLPGKERARVEVDPPVAAAGVVPGGGQAAAAVAAASVSASDAPAAAKPEGRRSFFGQGRTMFMKEIVAETHKRSSKRMRLVVWSTVIALVGTVSGLVWWSEQRVRETTAALALQQENAQTQAAEDMARLRQELNDARNSSAPAAVLDSLREALDSATSRTLALEVSLARAQDDVTEQLAAAERLRAEREAELRRLNQQLREAGNSTESRQLMDSLRRAINQAEQQVNNIDGQLRAVRGSDLATVAQDNQGAVGLVSAYMGGQMFSGSGFVVSSSGYFVTNRHVVYQDGQADSVFVTMADHSTRSRTRATVVRIPGSSTPDLAILRIQDYDGPHMRKIDWSGTKARQGEPAALIGFPSGFAIAVDQSGVVRTSMAVGAFSMVNTDRIQFDGFTVGGSSGSPVFNAAGEVVAVHRAGLRERTGLGFAEPIHKAISLLPASLRSELGLPAN